MKNLPDFFRRGSVAQAGNPFREILRMQRQMDRIFDDLWGGSSMDVNLPTIGAQEFVPTCDVEETDSHFLLSFDLPGVKKEDIKIELREGTLTISGERKSETENKVRGGFRSERFHGSFVRTLQLPGTVKPEQVEASYSDGVLRVAVPKTEEARAQQIRIGEGKSGLWDKLLSHRKEEGKPSVVEKAA